MKAEEGLEAEKGEKGRGAGCTSKELKIKNTKYMDDTS